MGRITIDDISRHTGLSRGTVSRAINDRPDISLHTKQRVADACRELNYIPSNAARSLATGRNYAVSVIVPDFRSRVISLMLRGIATRARAERYAVTVTEVGSTPEETRGRLLLVGGERIDGVLLTTGIPAEIAEQFVRGIDQMPIVSLIPQGGLSADVVAPDYLEAGRLLAGCLLSAGDKALLIVHEPDAGSDLLLRGFSDVWIKSGKNFDKVVLRCPTLGAVLPAAERAVHERVADAIAIAASSDAVLCHAMLTAAHHNRLPPRTTVTVGVGNDPFGATLLHPISSIDLRAEEVGHLAMDVLLQRIGKTRHDAYQTQLLTPELKARGALAGASV